MNQNLKIDSKLILFVCAEIIKFANNNRCLNALQIKLCVREGPKDGGKFFWGRVALAALMFGNRALYTLSDDAGWRTGRKRKTQSPEIRTRKLGLKMLHSNDCTIATNANANDLSIWYGMVKIMKPKAENMKAFMLLRKSNLEIIRAEIFPIDQICFN